MRHYLSQAIGESFIHHFIDMIKIHKLHYKRALSSVVIVQMYQHPRFQNFTLFVVKGETNKCIKFTLSEGY